MKTMGVEVQIHVLLIPALDGDAWSASRPCCFTPEVGHKTGLDAVEK
jgi:hypothetical protein